MPRPLNRSPESGAYLRRIALGSSIREARGELSQTELGRRLESHLGELVSQAAISRWEAGTVDLTLEQVRALELALGLRLGTLGGLGGYTAS